MSEPFEYVSHARLEYRNGLRQAFLGDVKEPVVYGVQGALREYYGAKEGPPIAATLDHIVAAVAGWMYGTLAGALAGREVPLDRSRFTATADGRIVGQAGVGKPIRIESIRVHYTFAVPREAREPTERALAVHPRGCPAHESVKDAIKVAWDATVTIGDETVVYRSEQLSG